MRIPPNLHVRLEQGWWRPIEEIAITDTLFDYRYKSQLQVISKRRAVC